MNQQSPEQNEPQPLNPMGVDLNKAAGETAAWRSFMDKLEGAGHQDRVYSYFIPIADVFNLINIGIYGSDKMPQVEQIDMQVISGLRAYFALRPPGENGPNAQEMLHLYMVPVDMNGNDILDVEGNSVIYDTTQPCPNMCGVTNPLNGGTF